MADSKTFVLVGNFQDNITPALNGINKTLDSVKRNLGSFSAKRGGFDDLTKSMGKVISAHKVLNQEVRTLQDNLKSTITVLREYRSEVGKAVRANTYISTSGSRAAQREVRFWDSATKSAQAYNRTIAGLKTPRTLTPGTIRQRPARGMPSGGDDGGGGRGPRGGFSSAVAGGVAGGVIGSQLENVLTNAIVGGFQIGVNIMKAPFEYFAGKFAERVGDEMSDVRAAGGLFAINKLLTAQGKLGFVSDFREAEEVTRKNNRYLAQLAGSLPGDTQEYIQVSKQISDGIYRVLSQDKDNFIKFANTVATANQRAPITGTGKGAMQAAGTEVLGEMTKLTVLAGLGGRQGPYGLPQLVERMVAEQQVSMGQFQRYAAIFRDPMIMGALERNIAKINQAAPNTAKRLEALRNTLTEIVTPELISRYRRTLAGFKENLKTVFLSPEVGLLGLGREIPGLGKKMNEFGQYLNANGEVVTDVNKAASANLSIFDALRDTLANISVIIDPILQIIPQLFDPLKALGMDLAGFRENTAKILKRFFDFNAFFKQQAEGMPDATTDQKNAKEAFKAQMGIRSTIAVIANLYRDTGVIDQKEYMRVARLMEQGTAIKQEDITAEVKKLVDAFFDSDIAASIGNALGTVVGRVFSEVGNFMSILAGTASGGKFAEGLAAGFKSANGMEGMKKIFKSLATIFIKLIGEIITAAPFESALIAAMFALPAIVGAAISAAVSGCMGGLFRGGACPMPGLGAGSKGGAKPGRAPSFGGFTPYGPMPKNTQITTGASSASFRAIPSRAPQFPNVALPGSGTGVGGVGGPYTAPAIPKKAATQATKSFGAFASLKGKGAGMLAAGMITLSSQAPALAKAGKSLVSIGRNIPLLGLAFAGLDFGLRKAEGQDTVTAASGAAGAAAGGVAGAALGSFIPIPVVGTVAGGFLGSMIGGWIGENLVPIFDNIKNAIQSKWAEFTTWASSGFNIGKSIGQLTANLENAVDNIGIWFNSLPGKFNNWAAQFRVDVGKAFTKMAAVLSDPAEWGKLWTAFTTGFTTWIDNVKNSMGNWFKGLASGFQAGYNENRNVPGQESGGGKKAGYLTRNGVKGWMSYSGEWTPLAKGGLGDAVATELKNKPHGSDLVVANSSETIIPAAGGIAGAGMLDFVRTLQSGFSAVVRAVADAKQQQQAALGKINQTLVNNQQQTNLRLTKLETKFTTPGLGGAMPSGGGVDAFNPIAGKYGLTMTSGYRPGDPGWHGANRARDYSNGTGPTVQMMQFAQFMASTYGRNLKELIYTPLGFSIKNGQRVAPYAQAGHYNHVHVAYATGYPTFGFQSQAAALDWERRATMGNVKVASITARQGEFGGSGPVTVNAPITINTQQGQDADTIASLVVMKLSMAIDEIRNHTA